MSTMQKTNKFRNDLDIDKNARICKNAESDDHIYSPYIKDGECRFFVLEGPYKFFLSNKVEIIQ